MMENHKRKNDDNSQNLEEEEKKERKFSAGQFRRDLKQPNGWIHVKEFVRLAKDNTNSQDVVMEYLEAGGSVQELLNLLDASAKGDLTIATPIFFAVGLLFVKVHLSAQRQKQKAEEGASYIIHSLLATINSMIMLNSTKHRKAVLMLLVGIITLKGSLAREILSSVSIPQRVLVQLLKPSTANDSLRFYLINYVMAFLTNGDTGLIKSFVEKKGFLSSIIPNLKYDSAQTVTMVLTIIKEKVVKNAAITKTAKLNIFNTQIIQSLLELYDWKGPKNVPLVHPFNKKKNKVELEPNTEEKELVAETVDAFLQKLLCNRKLGIIFYDKTVGTQNKISNNLVLTALESLPRPWEKRMTSELVVNIFRACPDIFRNVVNSYEASMYPRPSCLWRKVVKFTKHMLDGLDPEIVLERSIQELTVQQLIQITRNMCAPICVVKNIVRAGLESTQPIQVWYFSLQVLIKIWSRLLDYQKYIISSNVLTQNDVRTYNNALYDFVSNNLPDTTDWWTKWRHIFSMESSVRSSLFVEEFFGVDDYLNSMLNLLMTMAKLKPEIIDETHLNYEVMLSDVNTLKASIQKSYVVDVKLNILLIMSMTDSSTISPDTDLFRHAVKTLLKGCKRKDTAEGSTNGLVKMLTSTGIFENNPDEILTWIYTFITSDNSPVSLLSNLITQSVIDCYNNPLAFQTNNDEEMFNAAQSITEDVIKSLMENSYKLNQIEVVKMPTPILSPLLTHLQKIIYKKLKNESEPITLLNDNAETNSKKLRVMKDFLHEIIVNLLHTQHNIKYFHNRVSQYAIILEKHTLSYINSWKKMRPARKPEMKKQTFSYKLNKWIYGHDLTIVEEVLDKEEFDTASSCLMFDSLLFNISSTMRMKFTPQTKNIIQKSLASVVYFLNNSDSTLSLCLLKKLYTHATLFDCFNIFSEDDRGVELFTLFACMLPKVKNKYTNVKRLNSYEVDSLLSPYRGKTLRELFVLVENNQLCLNASKFKYIKRLLKLDVEQVQLLLELLSHKADVNIYFSSDNKPSCYLLLLSWLIEQSLNVQHETVEAVINKDVFKFITKLYYDLLSTKCDSQLESPLSRYLFVVPGYLSLFNADTVTKMLGNNRFSSDTKTLAKVLLSDVRQTSIFVAFYMFHKKSKNIQLLFPLLAWTTDLESYNKLYKYVYDQHRCLVIASVAQVNVPDDYVTLFQKLIADFMSEEEASNVFQNLTHTSYQPKLAFTLVQKLKDKVKTTRFISMCLNSITTCLAQNDERVTNFCSTLLLIVDEFKDTNLLNNKVTKRDVWLNYVKASLRYGLRSPGNPLLIKTLSSMIEVVYDGTESKDVSISTIFDMTSSHSQFLNILFDGSELKETLLQFLLVMMNKDKSVMCDKHIPVFLASYKASLSTSDQYVLKILNLYESSGVNLSKYKPLLWGTAAVDHYSLNSSARTALWRQANSKNVLDLLDMQMLHKSIEHYPVDRKLMVTNETVKENRGDIYDPSFLLPVFANILSPGALVYCHTFVYSGGFSYTLCALSSSSVDMRGLAALVLSRFYNHVQLSQRSKQRQVWTHFMNLIRFGVEELEKSPIPSIITSFLSKATLDITQPLEEIHIPLIKFIIAKHYIDCNKIPEFLPLFHSAEIGFRRHRHWILQAIKAGIKQDVDLKVIYSGMLPKFILSFSACYLCDDETKILVIQVLSKIINTDKTGLLLTEYSLLPWLTSFIMKLSQNQEIIDSVVCLLNDIGQTLTNVKNNSERRCFGVEMLILCQHIAKYFTNSTSTVTFDKYLKLLRSCLLFAESNAISFRFDDGFAKSLISVGKSIFEVPDFCFIPSTDFYIFKDKVKELSENESKIELLKHVLHLCHGILAAQSTEVTQ